MTRFDQYLDQNSSTSFTSHPKPTCHCCRLPVNTESECDVLAPKIHEQNFYQAGDDADKVVVCHSCATLREITSNSFVESTNISNKEELPYPVNNFLQRRMPVLVEEIVQISKVFCQRVFSLQLQRQIFAIILLILCLSDVAAVFWRSPGHNGELVDTDRLCNWAIAGNRYPQAMICRTKPKVAAEIKRGLEDAIHYCQNEFANERWDCNQEPKRLFENLMREETKEKAYIQSLTAASIVHSITRACTRGDIKECFCNDFHPDNKKFIRIEAQKRNTTLSDEELDNLAKKLNLKACSDDVSFGFAQSETFLSQRRRNRYRNNVENHNYAVGRLTVKNRMKPVCLCQGISGACSITVCYDRMPIMREVAKELHNKYDESICVPSNRADNHVRSGRRCFRGNCPGYNMKKKRRGCRSPTTRRPSSSSLIYKLQSSNFCRRSKARGVLGTKNRKCNATGSRFRPGSCKHLCCNRGFNWVSFSDFHSCNCSVSSGPQKKFKCEKCAHIYQEARCN